MIWTATGAGPTTRRVISQWIKSTLISTGSIPNQRVTESIRSRVNFEVMDADDIHFEEKVDFVFCRNMLLYLPAQKRQRVIAQLKMALMPGRGVDAIITDSVSRAKVEL